MKVTTETNGGEPFGVPIFDAHFHIIDDRHPLIPNHGYLPEPFGCPDYLSRAAPLGISGGAVVSGSFQGFDQGYLLDALARLGPGFVGVTQLPADVEDSELLRLEAAGVRAIRFNLRRGPPMERGEIEGFANRVHELVGWHSEFYGSGEEISEYEPLLRRLPKVVVDHLGLSAAARPALLRLAESGAFVKATGFGRLDFDPLTSVKEIQSIAPGSLLFGTDLPSTRAPRPFRKQDLWDLADALGDEALRAVLFGNAVSLYRPESLGQVV